MAKGIEVLEDGKKISIPKTAFVESGGEGSVYAQNGKAFKIYHDPANMIPIGKIGELKKIGIDNVIFTLFGLESH